MRLLNCALLLFLVMLQVRLWLGEGGLPELWSLERAQKLQQRENQELSERNASLAAEVRDLKEGLEAVEERARSEMGMIADGEVFYQIIEPSPAAHGGPELR